MEDPFGVPVDFVSGLFSLEGRVAAVTGAASGLGAAMAIGLAQAAATVILIDVSEEGLARVESHIASRGGRSSTARANVTDRRALAEVAADVASRFGRIDILVNSAGISFRAPAEDFPEERFDAIIAANLKGTYLSCQAFGRRMLESGRGSIINIASIGAFVAYPYASAYLASKGGVIQLTRGLALEWLSRGVRVNAIAPTLMDSPMTHNRPNETTATADFISSRMLRQRLGQPRELIGATIFLASDASALVTGHILAVDDGYLIA